MRKIFTIISAFLICGMLAAPVCEAQRGRGNGSSTRTEQQSHNGGSHNGRPGNSGRPTGNNHSRPTGGNQNRPGNSNQGFRPGNSGNHGNHGKPGNNNQGFRPGNSGNHGKPGNNNQGFRPGNSGNHGNHGKPGNNNQGFRPGNHGGNYHPGQNTRPVNPGFRPGGHGHHRPMPPFSHRPPSRPYMPAYRPWAPPVRPAHFRPGPRAPRFSSILGLTFGTALNISINALFNAGYNVSSYGNNVIYLNNVPLMNINWPYATLNYIDGSLRGSEFTFSTPAPDRSRYDMVYSSLMGQYGYPVSVQNNGGAIISTWWGYDNGYVTLSYYPEYAANGMLRYYTTLSIGG